MYLIVKKICEISLCSRVIVKWLDWQIKYSKLQQFCLFSAKIRGFCTQSNVLRIVCDKVTNSHMLRCVWHAQKPVAQNQQHVLFAFPFLHSISLFFFQYLYYNMCDFLQIFFFVHE